MNTALCAFAAPAFSAAAQWPLTIFPQQLKAEIAMSYCMVLALF